MAEKDRDTARGGSSRRRTEKAKSASRPSRPTGAQVHGGGSSGSSRPSEMFEVAAKPKKTKTEKKKVTIGYGEGQVDPGLASAIFKQRYIHKLGKN